MSLKLGSTSIGSIYLGNTKVAEAYLGNVKVYSSADPLNPLGLPPFTIRCQFSPGYTPSRWMGDSQTLVDAASNVWDIFKNSPYWNGLFTDEEERPLLSVLGANTSGVEEMSDMFEDHRSLTTVALFDTSDVTDMSQMFMNCRALTSIPLFNTSSVDNMEYMFYYCKNVQSGALALYQQASTQTTPPTNHRSTFANCGADTVTGAAELAQIPTDWGGEYDDGMGVEIDD